MRRCSPPLSSLGEDDEDGDEDDEGGGGDKGPSPGDKNLGGSTGNQVTDGSCSERE